MVFHAPPTPGLNVYHPPPPFPTVFQPPSPPQNVYYAPPPLRHRTARFCREPDAPRAFLESRTRHRTR